MYNIFIDKNELFEAKIELEGASLTDTNVRLLAETSEWNLLFQGEVDSSGNVSIPIKKLKSIFTEDTKGTLRLEVVADDTYFTPWEDDFTLSRSKRVVAEVKQKSKEPVKDRTPKVSVKQKEPVTQPIKEEKGFTITNSMSKDLLKGLIRSAYLSENKKLTKDMIRESVTEFTDKYDLPKENKRKLYNYIKEQKEVIEDAVWTIRI